MNDTSMESEIKHGGSTSEALPRSAYDDYRRSEEIESLITNIRMQIRKRDFDGNHSSTESGASNYHFGERLNFGLNGNGLQYLGVGWHIPEPSFIWTDALHASLNFVPPPSIGDLFLEFTAHGYINSKISHQDVIIEINGIPCCRIPISRKYTFSIVVPRSVSAAACQLDVRFTCFNRASPSQFKKRADHRVLGIALYSLVLREGLFQSAVEESRPERTGVSTTNGNNGAAECANL
jgi:hypothetical protein